MKDDVARPPFVVRAVRYAIRRVKRAADVTNARVSSARKDLYYRIRETKYGIPILKATAFAQAPRETRYRQSLAQQYNARIRSSLMDRRKGCGLFQSSQFGNLGPILTTCERLFEIKKAKVEHEVASWIPEKQRKFQAAKRKFLRNLLSNDDLRRNPEFVDFALSDAALGVATNYLGTIPYLNRIDLLYSVPRQADDKVASQLFHVDPEGLSQVKFFINVFEIGDSEGPFTFIPADDTARILGAIRALRRKQGTPHVGRYLDEEIAAVGGSDAIVSVEGPRGAGVVVDTSRCLHCGSRVQPGSFRLCLYLQYCTSREHGNVFDIKRFKKDPVRYLAVKHSLASIGTEVTAPHQMA